MRFEYLTNVPLEKAREDYLKALADRGVSAKTETVKTAAAAGRVTASPVYAKICAPHYNACAMDGIALAAELTFKATETSPALIKRELYTPVDTGDPLPPGCDTVIMAEDLIETDSGIKIISAAAPWQHIRQIGEDMCAGEMILPSFSEITPSALGAMIACGVNELSVVKRPTVGIIPTGNEVIMPNDDPREGEVLEFNSVIFSAMLSQWGAKPVTFDIVKDDPAEIKKALVNALSECDAVIVCAGSSAGSEDYSCSVISEAGEVIYHGIAIKPGKPTILGICGGKPVIGVPGYPVSGIIALDEFLRPVIEFLGNTAPFEREFAEAVLSKQVVSTLKYREFIRVSLGYAGDKLIAVPLNRGSGVVSSFMKADGILEVPQELEGYDNGAQVKVRLLRPLREIESSLVATGSHDPLLDELAELLRSFGRELSMKSSHVGSMGGITAIKRREAHVAGIHLLDEATGEYNVSFIEKHFPNGGVSLVECVSREQGLMLPKGNPKNIGSIGDIARDGISYVNRQKGSGTRILCDWLCRREGTDTKKVYGYDREEYTHFAVAAVIAAGSADAGLGIYSAAKAYGLDFLKICDEQYDLLIPNFVWDTPRVQRLLEILKSDAFADRLKQLGGYKLSRPGELRRRFGE